MEVGVDNNWVMENPALKSDHNAAADGYASEDFVAGSSSSRERKKGVPWTEEEHRMFLLGLQIVNVLKFNDIYDEDFFVKTLENDVRVVNTIPGYLMERFDRKKLEVTVLWALIVELYVGMGASRVRDLFARAKKEAPSIIFIDEKNRPCFPKVDAIKTATGDILAGQKKRPITLTWNGDRCSTVEITGLDIGWGQKVPLKHEEKHGSWTLHKDMLEGRYEYKYIVDGEWTTNANEPLSPANNDGHINNYIMVVDKDPESISATWWTRLGDDYLKRLNVQIL